ncbi:sugar phosphate isomerase/epimerase family protein [Celerinatantimonas sp. YJH-8]|uniref:sugar phosphate isomerase/epimerase family protein n=1 Tax=Celerinatantimonas sp. YJH-8 TaxID=3228714 RepID=UPI0038C931A3
MLKLLKQMIWLPLLVSCLFTVQANPNPFFNHHKPGASPVTIAVQMFTLRNVGSLDEQLAMAHEGGYNAVELVGTHGVDAQQMNQLLAKYQIKAISDHVQLVDLENNLDSVISFNRAIGNHVIVMPYLAPEARPTNARGWMALGQELNGIGAKLRAAGMTLAYHNHNFEMKKYNGHLALDWIAKGASANNLKFEFDVAWISRGGQDPAHLLNRFGKRVIAIHVKDNAGVGVHSDEGDFAVAGQGLLAWNEIMPAAQHDDIDLYIVEHDAALDPLTIITQAHEFLDNYFSSERLFPAPR